MTFMLKSGDIIDVIDVKYQTRHTFIIEIKQQDDGNRLMLCLAKPSNPYAKLIMSQSGSLDYHESSKAGNIKGGVFTMVKLITDDIDIDTRNGSASYYTISCAHKLTSNGSNDSIPYLAANTLGKLVIHCLPPLNSLPIDVKIDFSPIFTYQVARSSKGRRQAPSNISSTDKVEKPILQTWQYHRLLLEGYLLIPRIVSKTAIHTCLRLLNHQLGLPGAVVAGGFQAGLGKLSGSITNAEEIKNLLTSKEKYPHHIGDTYISTLDVVEELFGGAGTCDLTRLNAQIAFRFPELPTHYDPVYIDTADWHTDGYRQGNEHGFSLLLGMCLSDTIEDFHGNLIVWPGSHTYLHSMKIGDHGEYDIDKLTSFLTGIGIQQPSSSISLEDHHDAKIKRKIPLPSLGDPYQVHMRVGDIVILHPDLAHTGGPNTMSCDIRKMIYFRLRQTTCCQCKCDEKQSHHMHDGYVICCCHTCGCDCKNGFWTWDDVVLQHRDDMWVDIKAIQEIKRKLSLSLSLSQPSTYQSSLSTSL